MPSYGEKTLKRLHEAFRSGNIDKLDDHDAAILNQISFADDQIRKVGPSQAAHLVKTKFELNSLRQAFYVVEAAQMCFGSMHISSKEYWKNFAIDKLVIGINYIGQLLESKEEKDEKGNTRVDDNGNPIIKMSEVGAWELGSLARLIKELRETVGFSKEDDIATNWEEAGQHLISFTGDVTQIGITPLTPQARNKLLQEYLPDADHTEQNAD